MTLNLNGFAFKYITSEYKFYTSIMINKLNNNYMKDLRLV